MRYALLVLIRYPLHGLVDKREDKRIRLLQIAPLVQRHRVIEAAHLAVGEASVLLRPRAGIAHAVGNGKRVRFVVDPLVNAMGLGADAKANREAPFDV